ncbi:uncharacterized protein N7483_003118 [Penicillium malachiteum]|uniref:uncharacterized protein n=1 Tax=Penicillium malachiteum TaxID=1324776 RepID=UPI0025499145|nr:uncharacterized protein N7483_003118 [Penicillium malachiteum]KAJ5728610.1 hypothetical protein N7483_003118 [Penicillium malachiteum]
MKILMLHGSRQSGELFSAKLQALEKLLKRAFGSGSNQPGAELIYPTAPFSLAYESPSDTSKVRNQHGSWTWFQSESLDESFPGLDASLTLIASILRDSGPFDGIVGFSQGGALAAMVASLLEENRSEAFARLSSEGEGGIPYPDCFAQLNHPPLKFVVCISGYAASHSDYRAFYNPAIQTPMLHFLGSMDTVVEEESSMKLVGSCYRDDANEPAVIWHSGGHIVPGGKRELSAVTHFINLHKS